MINSVRGLAMGILALLCLAAPTLAQDIRIVTYNVESDSETSPAEVAIDIQEIGGADIWRCKS